MKKKKTNLRELISDLLGFGAVWYIVVGLIFLIPCNQGKDVCGMPWWLAYALSPFIIFPLFALGMFLLFLCFAAMAALTNPHK